jgi:nitrogen fixation protein FixH
MDERIIKLAERIYAGRIVDNPYMTGQNIKDFHAKQAENSILAAQVFYEVKKGLGK